MGDRDQRGLSAEELRVISVHNPPFVKIHQEMANHFTHSGYLIDLWNIISAELDLRYRLLPPRPGGYGALLHNGSWTGMVGELAEKRADVALAAMFYREDRAAVLDYVNMAPVWSGHYEFHMRAGERDTAALSGDMFASLLRPLHQHVWPMLFLSLVALAIVLVTSVRLSRGPAESGPTRREFSFGFSCLSVLMTVTGQGWAVTPVSAPARIVTICSWITGLLITFHYTANMVSHLTVVQPAAPISSLAEFATNNDWTLAMEDGLGIIGSWARSPVPAERHLYERTASGERFLRLNGTPEAFLAAVQPRTLLFYDQDLVITAIGEEACHLLPLVEPDPRGKPEATYLVLRKGLKPLRSVINKTLLRLMQTGTLSRLKRRWLRGSRQLCPDQRLAVRPLTLADMLAVIVIVPLAAIGAGLVLAGELLASRLRCL
ncbi:glutamate receptor ionotropic, kainate 5-like [Pollicipes pollicipes]|uniref:glutamate receptor ionotropic, kainate 5-like n=1 Tax=Pollicipes pollicipes TaxID=41117 RepID=UPI001885558B|nr:glutamate receptor ionotropic, kainate 5-like [Pollicipes pollicipes]